MFIIYRIHEVNKSLAMLKNMQFGSKVLALSLVAYVTADFNPSQALGELFFATLVFHLLLLR